MGRPRQRVERNRCVLWIEQAVQLRTARFQFGSHRPFCLLLPDHLLLKLPGKHALDRDAFYFVSVSFLFQEIIETRSAVYPRAFLCHRYFSLLSSRSWTALFFRASSRSAGGVLWLFLMKPCSRTILPFVSI